VSDDGVEADGDAGSGGEFIVRRFFVVVAIGKRRAGLSRCCNTPRAAGDHDFCFALLRSCRHDTTSTSTQALKVLFIKPRRGSEYLPDDGALTHTKLQKINIIETNRSHIRRAPVGH